MSDWESKVNIHRATNRSVDRSNDDCNKISLYLHDLQSPTLWRPNNLPPPPPLHAFLVWPVIQALKIGRGRTIDHQKRAIKWVIALQIIPFPTLVLRVSLRILHIHPFNLPPSFYLCLTVSFTRTTARELIASCSERPAHRSRPIHPLVNLFIQINRSYNCRSSHSFVHRHCIHKPTNLTLR